MSIETAQADAARRRATFESLPPQLRAALEELRRQGMKSGHDQQYREARNAILKAYGEENG